MFDVDIDDNTIKIGDEYKFYGYKNNLITYY